MSSLIFLQIANRLLMADNKQLLVVYSKGVGKEFYKNNIHDNRAVFFATD